MSKANKPASASKGLQNITLRVYKGYAVVEGEYPLSLDKGTSKFQIEGLPTAYQQRSLQFEPFLGVGEVTLGPRRFRAQNLDRQTLRDLFLNKEVTVRYSGAKGVEKQVTGHYLGIDGNTVFLKVKKGKVREVYNFLAFDFDQLPDGVSNTPALEVTVTASKKGDYIANIAFKSNGFDWDADYVLTYDEKGSVVDWSGEIHITNESGANYPNAQVSVVAGDTNQARNRAMPMGRAMAAPQMASFESMDASGGGAEAGYSKQVRTATAESLGQVKEYMVPDRGDVQQGEDQTLDFFAANAVPVVRELRVRSYNRWHAQNKVEMPVRTILQFQTGKDTPLSMPLPGGNVTVKVKNKAGKKVEAGGAVLLDTPCGGDELKLETGTDFDVKASRIVKDEKKEETFKLLPQLEVEEDEAPQGFEGGEVMRGPQMSMSPQVVKKPKTKLYEKTTVITKNCAFEVFNGKDEPVAVVFEEYTDNALKLQNGHGFSQVSNGKHEQTVTVEAGKKASVPYTLVYTGTEQLQLTDAQFRAVQPK